LHRLQSGEVDAVARIIFGLFIATVALFQAAFFPAVGLLEITPDFVLVFLLIWSSSHGILEGMVWAFGVGLWLDLVTLDPLGTHALALLPVVLIGGLVSTRLFRSGAVLPILAVVAATFAYHVVEYTMNAAAGDVLGVGAFLRLTLLAAMLNALLVPVSYGSMLIFERVMPSRVS
jgi:rod shape-determining protein MreD